MEELSESEKNSLYAAIGVLVLSILAIISFFYLGSSIVFYILAVLAIVFGFYMLRRVSLEAKQAQAVKPKKK